MSAAAPPAAADAVDRRLRALCAAEHGPVDPARLALHRRVPVRARKHCQREFTILELDGVPRYIAKQPLSPEDGKVAAEYDKLRALPPGAVRVPQPLGAVGRGFVMRYVGECDFPEAFAARPDPADRMALVLAAVDQVAAFHRARPGAPVPADEALALAREYAGGWPAGGAGFEAAVAGARVGAMHGDLGPWNVRCGRDGGGLSVIDWEDYRERGFPVLDLLNLVVTVVLLVHPGHAAEGMDRLYERAFLEPGPFRGLAAPALSRYAAATGVRPAHAVALLPLFCQGMVHRIQSEGRPTDQMFYEPFMARFAAEPRIRWIEELG